MGGYLHDSQAVAHRQGLDTVGDISRSLHGNITGFSTGLATDPQQPMQVA